MHESIACSKARWCKRRGLKKNCRNVKGLTPPFCWSIVHFKSSLNTYYINQWCWRYLYWGFRVGLPDELSDVPNMANPYHDFSHNIHCVTQAIHQTLVPIDTTTISGRKCARSNLERSVTCLTGLLWGQNELTLCLPTQAIWGSDKTKCVKAIKIVFTPESTSFK